MRKPTTDKPPQVEPRLDLRSVCGDTRQLISQVRQYELITPLFGGGVEPAVADPVTVVRGSEIRGHLRFWWRACRGGQFGGDLARMKESDSIGCRNCHSFTAMNLVEQDKNAQNKHADAEAAGKTCIDCHKGVVHKLPRMH